MAILASTALAGSGNLSAPHIRLVKPGKATHRPPATRTTPSAIVAASSCALHSEAGLEHLDRDFLDVGPAEQPLTANSPSYDEADIVQTVLRPA